MKKLLLSALIIAAATQLKAQQLQMNGTLTPLDTNVFKIKIDSNWLLKQKLNFPSLKLNSDPQLLAQLTPMNNRIMVYNAMPVLVPDLGGFKMPVVKTDKPGEHYQMLIKKINYKSDNLAIPL